jgi:hypothetical protein
MYGFLPALKIIFFGIFGIVWAETSLAAHDNNRAPM